MEMYADLMAGPLGIVILLVGFVWGILMLFAPFFWYGTNNRTREISKKMDELIEIEKKAPRKMADALNAERKAGPS